MAEDHESGSGHQDPSAENHILSDRQSQRTFFEGRHIDHDSPPLGSSTTEDTSQKLKGLLGDIQDKKLPSQATTQRVAEKAANPDTPVEPTYRDPNYVQRDPRFSHQPWIKMAIRAHHNLGDQWKKLWDKPIDKESEDK